MDVDIQCSPAYSLAYCFLAAGESVLLERGALVAMSGDVKVGVGIGSGVGRALLRRAVGQEGFLMGRYTAVRSGAWVACASPMPGDVAHVRLDGSASLLIESGSLLAAGDGVEVDVRYAGLRNVMLREGAVMLRAAGSGDVLVAALGGIQRFDLAAGEVVVVDTGHVVGFHETVEVRVGPLSSVASATFTGEGLVGEFTGPGSLWVQTRAEGALRRWLLADPD